ncbi:hypothetical protein CTEN210_16819 [Chaetoceros tenuissimus]|uniref:MYND-type domain-containing protein n=1 Tax=Chaetoceros tenuissimus TaxID=426638 RepID=A0AAD3D9P5_9STRA|nr:hypothetical protein CTEN210_16819 [Chaetoceros tenuissimus]
MGKKSKRRTGTRSKKKETRDVNPSDEEEILVTNESEECRDELAISIASLSTSEEFENQYKESCEDKKGHLDVHLPWSAEGLLPWSTEGQKAFEEFMLWSLSDKVDLTPKKFERIAIAKMVIKGDISIEDIMLKRSEILANIESQLYTFEMGVGIELLMAGMKFNNLELESEVRSQLIKVLTRNHRILPMHLIVYDSFQEVVSLVSSKRRVRLQRRGFTEDDFDQEFHGALKGMVTDMVMSSVSADNPQDMKYMTVFLRYYMRRSQTTKEESFGNTIYARRILVDLLKLFEEMHSCWRCKQLQLHGEGIQAKTLICASCKCAVYCSRECQVKHWSEGRHKECCEKIGLEWSLYEARKRRVGKALQKGRIFTKPIIVNGKQRECFLRPSKKLDYYLCHMNTTQITRLASMDTFYENVARLACGGKHPIFGDDTISLKLQEKISTEDYKKFPIDFDRGSFTGEKVSTMLNIAEILKYQTNIYDQIAPKQEDLHCYELSVDQFITIYVCYEPYEINQQFDRFRLGTGFLQELKKCNGEMHAVNAQQRDCKNENILEALKESNHDEEENEDVSLMDGGEQEATYRCPVLSSYMKKPIRNTICGHVYDNEGIRYVYKTKKSCPISGCGKPFNLNDLEEDLEMAMKLRRFHKRKQAEKRRSDAMTQELDDEGDDDNHLDQKPTTIILE